MICLIYRFKIGAHPPVGHVGALDHLERNQNVNYRPEFNATSSYSPCWPYRTLRIRLAYAGKIESCNMTYPERHMQHIRDPHAPDSVPHTSLQTHAISLVVERYSGAVVHLHYCVIGRCIHKGQS